MKILNFLKQTIRPSQSRGIFKPTVSIDIDRAWHDAGGDDFICQRIGLATTNMSGNSRYAHSAQAFMDTTILDLLQSFSGLSRYDAEIELSKSLAKKDIQTRDVFEDLNRGLEAVKTGQPGGHALLRDYDFTGQSRFTKLELISAFCLAAYMARKLQDRDILPLLVHPEIFTSARQDYQKRLSREMQMQSETNRQRAEAVQLEVEDDLEFLKAQPDPDQLLWAQVLMNMLADDLVAEANWIARHDACSLELAFRYLSMINEWLWEDPDGPTADTLHTVEEVIQRLQRGGYPDADGWVALERPEAFGVDRFNARVGDARARFGLPSGTGLRTADLAFLQKG